MPLYGHIPNFSSNVRAIWPIKDKQAQLPNQDTAICYAHHEKYTELKTNDRKMTTTGRLG